MYVNVILLKQIALKSQPFSIVAPLVQRVSIIWLNLNFR